VKEQMHYRVPETSTFAGFTGRGGLAREKQMTKRKTCPKGNGSSGKRASRVGGQKSVEVAISRCELGTAQGLDFRKKGEVHRKSVKRQKRKRYERGQRRKRVLGW